MTKTVDGVWPEFVRDQLLPALKGGEYRQAHSELRAEPPSFCCLGVVCDLLIRAGEGELRWVSTNERTLNVLWSVFSPEDDPVRDFLPKSVADRFGVNRDPMLYRVDADGEYVFPTTLATLNDDDWSGHTYRAVVQALEAALDPDDREWFFGEEDAQRVANA